MMDKPNELNSLYQDTMHQLKPQVDESDYSILDKYVQFLEQLDAIDGSSISIFDMYRRTHVYASPSYRKRLGINVYDDPGIEGFDRLMHPDDHLSSMRSGLFFMRMALNMHASRLPKCKLIQDFRIENGSGGWIRVVEQFTCLEMDKYGKPWLVLSILDISPDQDVDSGHRVTLIDTETGEMYGMPDMAGLSDASILVNHSEGFNPETQHLKPAGRPHLESPGQITNGVSSDKKNGNTGKETLSVREREILTLISEGFVSKQVADKLSLSVHTVNTHRRNIIEKMNVSNTAEAIRQAGDMSLI